MRHPHNVIDELAMKLRNKREHDEAQRQQDEALLQSLQIKLSAIEEPLYDNSDLFSLERWTARNLDALQAYLKSIDAEPDDFRVITANVYDRQLERRPIIPRDPNYHEEEQRRERRTWQAIMADEVGVREFGEI